MYYHVLLLLLYLIVYPDRFYASAQCNPGEVPMFNGFFSPCTPCPIGSYQNNGETVCTLCDPGRFTNTVSRTSCTLCVERTFNNRTNSTSCASCPTSWYNIGTGNTVCTTCPLGTMYRDTSAAQYNRYCMTCANGRYAFMSGTTPACADCGAGRYNLPVDMYSLASTFCSNCTAGRYSTIAAATTCLQCPNGRASSRIASNSLTFCTNCTLGRYNDGTNLEEDNTVRSDPPGSVCKACWFGKFTNVNGSTLCTLCPAGKFNASRGATACTDCTRGLFKAVASDLNCSLCSPGLYTSGFGASLCTQCLQGKYNSSWGATECSDCPIGFYASEKGTVTCLPCAAGTFSNQTGQAQCAFCSPGLFSANSASTFCDSCLVGTYSNRSNSSSCQICTKGEFSSVPGSTFCTLCFEGSFSNASGSSFCELCLPGKYSLAKGSDICDMCLPGTYSKDLGFSRCELCLRGRAEPLYESSNCSVTCPPGMFSLDGYSNCSSCVPGTFQQSQNSSTCMNCTAGYFSNNSAAILCSRCPYGKYSNDRATGCTDCPSGKYTQNDTSAGLTSCVFCEAGKYGTELRTCLPCKENTFSNEIGRNVTCESCPSNSFTETVGSRFLNECVPCPGGYKMVINGSNLICEICDFHQFANGSSTLCEWCPEGYYTEGKGKIFAECLPCDVGKFQIYSQDGLNRSCQVCPLNMISDSGKTSCQGCAFGKYTPFADSLECLDCDIGYRLSSYSHPNRTCDICPRNTYNGYYSFTTCLNCPLWGTTVSSGSISFYDCLLCTAGKYMGSRFLNRSCEVCPLNTYSRNNASSCTFCAPGKHTVGSGSDKESLCIPCVAGKYSNASGLVRVCDQCPKNFFSPIGGSTFCQSCSVGFYTGGIGSAQCVPCNPGYFYFYANDSCNACPSNRYADLPGKTSCAYCPAGKSSNSFGSSFCSNCDPGFFKSSPEALCKLCPPNTIARYAGQTSCDSCSLGRYTPNNGSTACLNCDEGSYRSALESECIPCPENSYSTQKASFSCIICPVGSHAPSLGSTSCEQCPPGSLNIEAGTSCDIKSVMSEEQSAIFTPAVYSFYMLGSLGLFFYFRMNLYSSLTLGLMLLDFIGNFMYALNAPFYYDAIRFPLYIWFQGILKSLIKPVKSVFTLDEWESEGSSKIGRYIVRSPLAFFLGIPAGLIAVFMFSLCTIAVMIRYFKVIPCGFTLYLTNLIVFPPIEKWYKKHVMDKAPPGMYDMDAELDSSNFSKRVIHIFAMHIRVQTIPCLLIVLLNSASLRQFGSFGIYKLGISFLTLLFGLYFMMINGLICASSSNSRFKKMHTSTGATGNSELVHISVSAIATDQSPAEDIPPPPPPPSSLLPEEPKIVKPKHAKKKHKKRVNRPAGAPKLEPKVATEKLVPQFTFGTTTVDDTKHTSAEEE